MPGGWEDGGGVSRNGGRSTWKCLTIVEDTPSCLHAMCLTHLNHAESRPIYKCKKGEISFTRIHCAIDI